MALTNAEKQRRWRDKRNAAYEALHTGTPKQIAEAIFVELGDAKARKVVRELDKRLKRIKPDCPACLGTGFRRIQAICPDTGEIISQPLGVPCDCNNLGPSVDEARAAIACKR